MLVKLNPSSVATCRRAEETKYKKYRKKWEIIFRACWDPCHSATLGFRGVIFDIRGLLDYKIFSVHFTVYSPLTVFDLEGVDFGSLHRKIELSITLGVR